MRKFNKNKIIIEGNIIDIENYLDTLNNKVKERLSKKDIKFLDTLFKNFVCKFPLENLEDKELTKEAKKLQEQLESSLNEEQQKLLDEWGDLENECVFTIIKQAVFYGFYANLLLGNLFITI